MTDEGIRALPRMAPRIVRTEKVSALLRELDDFRVILIRSAPATGKTSLMQQLEDHLRGQQRAHGVLRMTNSRMKKEGEQKLGAQTFDEYFETSIGTPWFSLLMCQEDCVLLLDEAQMVYTDYASAFWGAVENLASKNGPGVRIAMFAVYGDTVQTTIPNGWCTPFTLSKTLGADFLQCSPTETQQLIADFCERQHIEFPPILGVLLHKFAGGHIGMIRAALEGIHNHFTRRAPLNNPITIGDVLRYMLSSEMLSNIHVGIRSPPNFAHLPDESKNMLTQIMHSGSTVITTSSPQLETAHDLMERNIVRWNEEESLQTRVCFINEAIQRLTYAALCSSKRPLREPPSLPEYLLCSLPLIRSDFLRENTGICANDVLLEPVWQMEFYRCSTASLHAKSHITPSLGRIFNSQSQLDFYIGDKQWLIKITRA